MLIIKKRYSIQKVFKENLIGYTALRKRPYTDGKHKKSYLLFDTLIVVHRKKFCC